MEDARVGTAFNTCHERRRGSSVKRSVSIALAFTALSLCAESQVLAQYRYEFVYDFGQACG